MSAPAPTSAAYRGALLALQKQQRARLQLLIQQTEAQIAADWTRGPGIVAQYYAPLIDAYAKALNDLRTAEDDPAAKLSLSWLTSQNAQLASIEQSVRASMLNYGQQAARTVEDAQLAALARGQQDAEALTQEALSPAWAKGVNPALLWNRPNPDAIAAWAGRAGNGHPLGDLFAAFPEEAAHEARQVLLMGLATGANPKTLVTGLQQAMGISRSRALTISRTELLGSYRTAAHESYRANADVLQGWLWSAAGNCCAMCAGMDGTLHDLYEDLVDHPCGRCAPIPVTKSWDDILGPLGIDTSDMEETSIGAPGNYTSISEKFDSYSPEKQRAIIGTQTGYEAYRRGEVSLKDFIGVRPAQDGWPSQYYQRSLKELQIPTRQASRLVELRPDLLAKYQAGRLRASDLGKFTPYEQLPAWAKQSKEAEIVYQILRNGLPYNMTSHEQGLLITNLEQMLKGELPTNVRAAAERQLLALGQSVERQTVGAAAKDVAEQAAARDVMVIPSPKDDLPKRYGYDPAEKLAEVTKRLFGRELTPDEVASMVGAPEGSYVTYSASGDAIKLELHGPGWNPAAPYDLSKSEYNAERILFLADDGKLEMGNMTIDVRQDLQGSGIGGDIFADQVQSLRELGVSRINTFAAGGGDGTLNPQTGDVGYYVWPRLGYIGNLPLESRQALRAAAAAGDVPSAWADFKTVQQLMRTPEGRDWWKRYGESLDLTFNLSPNSLSSRILRDYLAQKGMR